MTNPKHHSIVRLGGPRTSSLALRLIDARWRELHELKAENARLRRDLELRQNAFRMTERR